MNSKWQTKKLGDICELINRGVSPKYTPSEGICVLNQKCVRDHKINFDLARVHDIKAKKISHEKIIQVGDVLVNSTGTGTLGRVAQVKELSFKATVDSHITIVRPIKNIFDVTFFGYAMIFIEEEIAKRGDGCGGQTELARNTLKNDFIVTYPASIAEQKNIVFILERSFDAIAKAKVNAEQNLKNAKELFHSIMKESFEKQTEGWMEYTVQELVNNGLIFKPLDGNHGEIHPLKSDYLSIGIPFIMSRDMKCGTIDEQNCKFIREKQARSLRTGFAVSGDVLLSHKGTIGSAAILHTKHDFVVLTPQITYYRVKDSSRILNRFIYYQFLSPMFQRTINRIAESGSTRAYIGITKQLSLKLSFPSLSVQKTIVKKLDSLSDEIKRLESIYHDKIISLVELKKSILQKALSGELTRSEVYT